MRGKTADAVVVGGGVAGLVVARALSQRGLSVTLVERGRLGAEASNAAAGMLAPQAEADAADKFFELACASRDLYPAFADALREETGTDIELERTGTLYLAFTEEDERETLNRYVWQTDAGLPVERLSGAQARELEPCISEDVLSALRFPLDVQVENRRLVTALATSVEKLNVALMTGTLVESLCIERGRVEGVETARGFISSPKVVVASGAWTSSLSSNNMHVPNIRIEPVRGQMLCFETKPLLARHVIYSPRGYIVPRLDGRLLAGSTSERAGFDKRVTAAGIQMITTNALEISSDVGVLPLLDAWAGLRPRAADGLPVIGACDGVEGLFYATGHYRNGILLAPVTGELLAEQIVNNRTPRLLEAFTPDRFQYAGIA